MFVRDFDTNNSFAGNNFNNTDTDHRQRAGKIFGKSGHAAGFDAGRCAGSARGTAQEFARALAAGLEPGVWAVGVGRGRGPDFAIEEP